MKLTTLLMFMTFFQVTAVVFSQNSGKVNLKAEKETVSEILKLIKEQTDYRFLYNSNNIDVERVVDIDCQHKSIEEVLQLLFEGTNVKIRSFRRNYVLYSEGESIPVPAQQLRSVTGKVSPIHRVHPFRVFRWL